MVLPLRSVVPPALVVSDVKGVVPPTAPSKVVRPVVLSVRFWAPSTVLPNVMAPPTVLVSVVSAPSVTASL